jgi:hypothetical protein
MFKKVLGAILLVIGVFIALVLFTYGGPVFPHLAGPMVCVTVGAILFFLKPKEKSS